MNRKRIREMVAALQAAHKLTVPVDVYELAKQLQIDIRKRDFDEELSGFAYQKNGEKVIGVNASDGPLRQRFTIAHELGHLFLDPRDDLNYDKKFVLQFRNGLSKEGTDIKEIEANYFAAELLMPEQSLKDELAQFDGLDFEDDEVVKQLADKYDVSQQAMSVRLASLHYI